MGLFKTSDGYAHVGRIAAVTYTFALFPGCEYFHRVDRLCVMRIVTAIGWWLAFAVRKRRVLKASEFFLDPVSLLGVLTLVIGLVGQSYFTGSRYVIDR